MVPYASGFDGSEKVIFDTIRPNRNRDNFGNWVEYQYGVLVVFSRSGEYPEGCAHVGKSYSPSNMLAFFDAQLSDLNIVDADHRLSRSESIRVESTVEVPVVLTVNSFGFMELSANLTASYKPRSDEDYRKIGAYVETIRYAKTKIDDSDIEDSVVATTLKNLDW
jgi:hypothetical protein